MADPVEATHVGASQTVGHVGAREAGKELTRGERSALARAALARGGVGGDALAQAASNPEGTRAAIKAATLASALGALSPETMLSDADRLKAIEVGAKIAGLYSDGATFVGSQTVLILADMAPKPRVLDAGGVDDELAHVEAPRVDSGDEPKS